MKHRLALVQHYHIDDIWMKILPHLLNGKEHWEDFFTLQEIKKKLITGYQQLWVMIVEDNVIGIVLTQIDEFPVKKVLRIIYLGGKGFVRSHVEMLADIEDWAKERDCKLVDIFGRDQWEPLVKKYGYKSPGRVYRKELK